MSIRIMRLRLQVQRGHFRRLRVAAGYDRQRIPSRDVALQRIQFLCGEIEDALYNAEKLL